MNIMDLVIFSSGLFIVIFIIPWMYFDVFSKYLYEKLIRGCNMYFNLFVDMRRMMPVEAPFMYPEHVT